MAAMLGKIIRLSLLCCLCMYTQNFGYSAQKTGFFLPRLSHPKPNIQTPLVDLLKDAYYRRQGGYYYTSTRLH